MNYQRILTVQDISCFGQCSLTVALPILSAAGHETCILPSALLSTHTTGFTGYTVRDLTEDLPGIRAHWQKEGICFHAIYTGYLGSAEQICEVEEIFRSCGAEDCITIVDPAMADNGKLYPAFDLAFVEQMKRLAFRADVLLPNLTEACLLSGYPYRESYDEAYIHGLLDCLRAAGAKTVVLTGVSYNEQTTGVVVMEGETRRYYAHKRYARGCHGTGDVYASAFVGALLRGKDVCESARIAADYTLLCIEVTAPDPTHWYGVKFEAVLPSYIDALR